MLRTATFFLLALSSLCFAQDDVFADGFNYPGCEDMSAQRSNLAVIIAPATGASDLKLRMSIADMPVRKGEALQGALVGQGGTAPYVYPPITGLPPGVSLNSTTGILSGTPTTVGRYAFIAEVQDYALADYKCTFVINVIPALEIIAGDPPDAENGLFWDYVFAISGNTGAVTWSTSGTLPFGIGPINSSTGEISGATSDFSGDYLFTVTATDGGSGDSIDIPCKITIYPVFAASPISHVEFSFNGSPLGVYTTYSQNFFAALGYGKAPYKIAYSGWSSTISGDDPSSQPDWISVDSTTGQVSGVPPGLGVVGFVVTATDALGATRLESISITIIDAVAAPGAAVGNGNVALFDGVTGTKIKDSGISLAGVAVSTANVASSVTLSHDINRFTAASVVGTTPASPADFQEIEILIEDASFTGCSLAAHSGQTVNGGASFSFDILPCVFRFRYNLAATNWFVTYYRIGTI